MTVLAVAIAGANSALAQGSGGPALDEDLDVNPGVIEEVVVTGRLKSATASLVDERIELPYSADFLGMDAISRAGDSTIGEALRRTPGLTLVDSKFIYVRGLDERYSFVTVNGAAVPSPDLARSVIPLDLFPASIVESIKIQKSYSPDLPASFGGGAIDIRTQGVPTGPVAMISVGTGGNSKSTGDDGLEYSDDGYSDMPNALSSAINRYRGNLSQANIANTETNAGNPTTLAEAEAIQRQLLLALNRDIEIKSEKLDLDRDLKIALGNAWDIGEQWVVGAQVSGAYNRKFRNKDQFEQSVTNPNANTADVRRTIDEERITAAVVMGLEYGEGHSLETNSYLIKNDVDQATITRSFDNNNQFPDQNVDYETRMEKRELLLNQISGTHTPAGLEWLYQPLGLDFLESLRFSWFYSDAEATTEIPNATSFQGSALLDPATGEQVSTQINATTSAGKFEFLELEDEQESWGGNVELPLSFSALEVTLSGGWWGLEKTREYFGYTANLDAVGVSNSALSGTPGDVVADANLGDLNNDFRLSMGSGFGNESYVAAQKTDAVFGAVDFLWNQRWRLAFGGRFEDYQQGILPVDLLDYTGVSVIQQQQAILNGDSSFAFQEDDIYASVALSFIGQGLLGTEEYQFRGSYGETVVRPDLREIADVVYLDPEVNVRVAGNPALTTSPIDNVELRGEFYYANNDNFTVSLFYKDVESPIEKIERLGSDDNRVLTFINGESGKVYGIEIEGLVTLSNGFFLSGNATFSDSEIEIDTAGTGLTNDKRRLTGHSKYLANANLGYDSEDGYHSASLLYNVFGERIFFAGTSGNDDAYELPFHSVDFVYSFYPTEQWTLKFKVQNLLDQKRRFEQDDANSNTVEIIKQYVGTSVGFDVKWQY